MWCEARSLFEYDRNTLEMGNGCAGQILLAVIRAGVRTNPPSESAHFLNGGSGNWLMRGGLKRLIRVRTDRYPLLSAGSRRYERKERVGGCVSCREGLWVTPLQIEII